MHWDALKGILRPRLVVSNCFLDKTTLKLLFGSEKLCLLLFDVDRTEELTSGQLVEMEEDLQQQLARTEERVREEVRSQTSLMCSDL